MIDRLGNTFAANPDALQSLASRARAELGEPDLTVSAEDFDSKKLKVNVLRIGALKVTLPTADRIANHLATMRWAFLLSRRSAPFIISDSPFFKTNPQAPGCDGLLCRGIEVTFPLSQHVALLATWHGEDERRRVILESTVAKINFQTGYNARRFLAGPSEAFPGGARIEQHLKQRGAAPLISSRSAGAGSRDPVPGVPSA